MSGECFMSEKSAVFSPLVCFPFDVEMQNSHPKSVWVGGWQLARAGMASAVASYNGCNETVASDELELTARLNDRSNK